jgi:hypothetical protein
MHTQDIKDVLTVSRILNVSSDPAVVIAALIEWRDDSLGTVETVVAEAQPEPAPAPAKAAPAKAAPKGRAKPPPPPADDDGPSPDPSDDADF